MGLSHPFGQLHLPHAVDDVESELFQFLVIEIVDMVQLLKEDDCCLTLRDFLDYTRPAERKTEYIGGLDVVSIFWRCEVVTQNVVTHHMDLLLDCAATLTRARFLQTGLLYVGRISHITP